MSNRVFGNGVRVKELSFITDRENNQLHTGYYPKIQVDGKWMLIRDENAVGKAVNAPTRKEALKEGRKILKEIKEKQALEEVSEE